MSASPSVVSNTAPGITIQSAFGPGSTPSLTSTLHHLKATASNATSGFNTSGIFNMPRWLGPLTERWAWLHTGGSVIAEATREGAIGMDTTLQGSTVAQGVAASAAAGSPAVEAASAGAFRHAFTFQHVRNFGGIFTYMTSKWALACFALVRLVCPGLLHWTSVISSGSTLTMAGDRPKSHQDLYLRTPSSQFDLRIKACITNSTHLVVPIPYQITSTSHPVPNVA